EYCNAEVRQKKLRLGHRVDVLRFRVCSRRTVRQVGFANHLVALRTPWDLTVFPEYGQEVLEVRRYVGCTLVTTTQVILAARIDGFGHVRLVHLVECSIER